jgi:hypothetical protein
MVFRLIRECCLSLRSFLSVERAAWNSGQLRRRCRGVCGGWIGQLQLREGYASDGGWAKQLRKYPWPVRRPRIAVDIQRGFSVYAVSILRRCVAAYVRGRGEEVNQVAQSSVYLSRARRRSQVRDIGICRRGGTVVACRASSSAASFPGTLVCPGTQWMVIEVP